MNYYDNNDSSLLMMLLSMNHNHNATDTTQLSSSTSSYWNNNDNNNDVHYCSSAYNDQKYQDDNVDPMIKTRVISEKTHSNHKNDITTINDQLCDHNKSKPRIIHNNDNRRCYHHRQQHLSFISRPSSSSSSRLSLLSILHMIRMYMIVIMMLLVCYQDYFVVVVNASYVIKMDHIGDIECYWIRVPKDRPTTISGNFDCWSEHEHMHAMAWIERADGTLNHDHNNHNILWNSKPNIRDEEFQIHVEANSGKYSLCFESILHHNRPTSVSNKHNKHKKQHDKDNEEIMSEEDIEDDDEELIEPVMVGFNIHVLNTVVRTLPDNEQGPNHIRAIDLLNNINQIDIHWNNLVDHYNYLRTREYIHYNLSKSIHTKIISWSILETILVICMAIGQVLYWKKFFEQRRYL